MNQFIYKKASGITVLSASFNDFKYKKHAHDAYALGVTLRGVQQYNLNGSFQSSYKNGVMLFNPEQSHDGMSQDKSGIDYVMLYINPSQFLEILDTKEMSIFSSPIVYDKILQKKILDISSSILGASDDALCNEYLINLADYLRPTVVEKVKKDHTLIKKAKEIIHDSLGEVISLDEISSELGLSKYQFIRTFKATLGISPYQYFLTLKIEKARRIIEDTNDVYLAVETCNFVDLAHLNKHFKGRYGVTPHEYIQHINN